MPRIPIGFDEDTFAEVRARALGARVSFAEAVRELVEWGLIEARKAGDGDAA